MGLAEIQKIYDDLYASKYNDLVKKKQQSLQDLDTQQATIGNQYTDAINNLNQRKVNTQNEYKTLYTGLDNQLKQGKEQYYGERNNAAVNQVQKAQQIRDWMAKNNLLASGESVDAQLRNNTDYSNNMGTIATNESNFNTGIADKRNQYGAQEQSAYNDIGNQISSANREKAQKFSDIAGKRTLIDSGFLGDEQALKSEIDAQRTKDIMDYNNAMAAAAASAARARASAARSSSGSSGSGRKSIGGVKADSANQFYAAFADLVDTGGDTGNVTTGNGVAKEILQNNKNDIVSQYGQSFYNKLLSYQFNNQPAWMRTDSGRAAAELTNSYNTVSGTRMGGYAD